MTLPNWCKRNSQTGVNYIFNSKPTQTPKDESKQPVSDIGFQVYSSYCTSTRKHWFRHRKQNEKYKKGIEKWRNPPFEKYASALIKHVTNSNRMHQSRWWYQYYPNANPECLVKLIERPTSWLISCEKMDGKESLVEGTSFPSASSVEVTEVQAVTASVFKAFPNDARSTASLRAESEISALGCNNYVHFLTRLFPRRSLETRNTERSTFLLVYARGQTRARAWETRTE